MGQYFYTAWVGPQGPQIPHLHHIAGSRLAHPVKRIFIAQKRSPCQTWKFPHFITICGQNVPMDHTSQNLASALLGTSSFLRKSQNTLAQMRKDPFNKKIKSPVFTSHWLK